MDSREPNKTTVRRVRQKDIAEVAGVTRSTVSIILSGKSEQGHIAPATRDRVLAAAQRMGYQSDPIAQRLKGISSRIVGIHTYGHDMSYNERNYNTEYLIGAQERATELGYDVLLFTATTQQDAPPSAFPGGSNRLTVADGAVIIGYRDDHDELARLSAEGYKFVRIDRRHIPGIDVAWVDSDHVAGTVSMVSGLLEAGYDRLLYIGAPTPAESFADRQEGFRQAISRFDLPADSIVLKPDYEITAEWLRSVCRKSMPTIVAERHDYAGFATEAAHTLGLDVPIAVLQSPFPPADSSLHCAYFIEPRVDLGRLAASILIDQIEGRAPERERTLPGAVRIRPPGAGDQDWR